MVDKKSIEDVERFKDLVNKYATVQEALVTGFGGVLQNKGYVAVLLAFEDRLNNNADLLGEIKQFPLSFTGVITKTSLQEKGWAICDGTTPASQGITDAEITATPDLQDKFLRMSNDESSGGTGGSETHNHTGTTDQPNEDETVRTPSPIQQEDVASDTHTHTFTTSTENNLPPYYELVYFIKVKT